MRDITIASDLVAGVDNHHPPGQVIRKDTRDLAQHGGFANAWPPKEQNALPGLDDVANDAYRAVYGSTDAAGQAHDLAGTVPNSRNAMQRAFDSSSVVVTESPNALRYSGQIAASDLALVQQRSSPRIAAFRPASEVHDHLNEVLVVARCRFIDNSGRHPVRNDLKQVIEVVSNGDLVVRHAQCVPQIILFVGAQEALCSIP
jgi:hypothetical protein